MRRWWLPILLYLVAAPALAQTTVNSSCTAAAGWATTPTNALAGPDSAYAITAVTGQPSLNITTCAFAIPAGATINGIQIRVVGCGNGTTGQRTMNVNVIGTTSCNTKTIVLNTCPSNLDTTVGTTVDTWGCANLSPSVVNASGFGATINTNTSHAQTEQIDLVTLSVTYTGGTTSTTTTTTTIASTTTTTTVGPVARRRRIFRFQ
jgi:hypothetical protein